MYALNNWSDAEEVTRYTQFPSAFGKHEHVFHKLGSVYKCWVCPKIVDELVAGEVDEPPTVVRIQ